MSSSHRGAVESSERIFPMSSRGPLSRWLMDELQTPPSGVDAAAGFTRVAEDALRATTDVVRDEDIQLTLFVLYGLHYGSITSVSDQWEWQPALISGRAVLEAAFEAAVRARVDVPPMPEARSEDVARLLGELTSAEGGPSLSRFVAKRATREQLDEFMIQRSVYTLREADPHSWAIPRLTGRPKAALVEIQSDEYGGGRPARMHSTIFAGTMKGMGLDATYGRYVENVPAITLASLNLMSMFGLNRRLRGAVVGHLAAFEMTSSIPNIQYGNGFRRLGFDEDVTWYFDEHVEADAVHEQIAAHDLAGSLAEDEPALLPDIVFGAAACLAVDGWAGAHILDSWTAGRSSLRVPVAEEA
jgi:hypothetical protein